MYAYVCKTMIPYQLILCRPYEKKWFDSESAVKSKPAADVSRRRRENVQVSHKIMNGKKVKLWICDRLNRAPRLQDGWDIRHRDDEAEHRGNPDLFEHHDPLGPRVPQPGQVQLLHRQPDQLPLARLRESLWRDSAEFTSECGQFYF